MGVAEGGIEEQVGQAVAGQVLGQWQAAGKDQAVARHTALLGLGAQVIGTKAVPLQQPEHTAGDPLQQAHPDIKDLGGDFVVVVEAAEDEAVLRQAQLAPGEGERADGAPAVVHLVGVGQVGDLFAVTRAVVRRDEDRVGYQVIDVRGPGGARVAEVMGLHRGEPVGEDTQPAVGGVALQVDGDVDLQLPRQAGGFQVGQPAHLEEAVTGAGDAARHVIVCLGPVGKSHQLKPRPVVQLQHLRHQVAGGVVEKISREITHPNAIVAVDFTIPEGLLLRRPDGADVGLGAAPLVFQG